MAKRYSLKIKTDVRNLRLKGLSLGEISAKLEIPKNTISGWVKNIKLTGRQQRRIKEI